MMQSIPLLPQLQYGFRVDGVDGTAAGGDAPATGGNPPPAVRGGQEERFRIDPEFNPPSFARSEGDTRHPGQLAERIVISGAELRYIKLDNLVAAALPDIFDLNRHRDRHSRLRPIRNGETGIAETGIAEPESERMHDFD